MDSKQPGPMTPFDEITVPRQLRFIKLLLPFLPVSSQRMLGILIKFMELQYTIQMFKTASESTLHSVFHTQGNLLSDPSALLEVLSPYLSSEEAETANTFRSLFQVMEMMQTFSGQEGTDSEGSSFNPMSMMMGMLSPEQQEMFETYQTMFSNLDSDADN
ncbi:MAG: hypothetical protein J5983_04160 [Ruminococcus sp.]|nr:hypothetical protein [Ruminococcus sp.]